MSGILRLESLTKGNTLKQGDKTPLKYRLFDADGEKLNIAGKSAKVRLMYPDFLRAGYESEPLTVSTDNTVTFSIEKVIQPMLYYLEITVDGEYIFPSRSDESKLNIDKSSKGSDVAIIEIIGKDVLINEVKSQVDTELQPLVAFLEDSKQAELERVQAENERSTKYESYAQQFNDVITDLSEEKDYHSLPEISGARGGFDTLGERLDDTDAKLSQTTMDVITGVIQPNIGEYITTNGFYGFGNTYRYAVLAIDGNENFSDSGKGFSISLQGEIKISDNAKITPVPSDRVSVGALGCNNDNDDKCFQSAYNLAKLRDCNVEVDVDVNIERFIDVHRAGSHEERRIVEISGRGVMSKNNSGYMFTNTLSRSGGNIKFNGVHFRSVEGAGAHIYHGGFLLRMYFENCHFIDVDHLTKAREAAPWDYMQTVYFSGGTVVGGKGWFIDAHTAYDVSFTHSIVEHREKFIKIGMNHSVRITDNLIEGIEGKVLEVKQGRSLVFDDNYMEYNGTIIEGPSITVDNPSFNYGFNEMMNFSFKNNLYIGTDTQINDANYYLMSIKNWGKTITVTNNFCDCNFLVVENRSTVSLMPTSLMDIYSNNVANAKKVLNDVNAPTFVSLGSGNLLKKFFERPLYVSQFVAFNPEQNEITTQDNSLVITNSNTGSSSNKIGFKIENILLARNTTYAVGLAALCNDANKESDGVQVIFTNRDTGSIVYKDLIEITDSSIHRGRVPFYSLNPFNNSTAQRVDIEVFIVPKSGSFSDSVEQRLSVANVVLQRGVVATDAIY